MRWREWLQRLQLERQFREFNTPSKGLRFLIADGTASGNSAILTLSPPRTLSPEEARVLGSYIKARLTCDLPRAVADCRVFELIRHRETFRVIQPRDKSFEEPSWFILSPYLGQLGPLGFNIEWDHEEGLFYARLGPMVINLEGGLEKLKRWQPVMEKVAEGYAHKIRTIEI